MSLKWLKKRMPHRDFVMMKRKMREAARDPETCQCPNGTIVKTCDTQEEWDQNQAAGQADPCGICGKVPLTFNVLLVSKQANKGGK